MVRVFPEKHRHIKKKKAGGGKQMKVERRMPCTSKDEEKTNQMGPCACQAVSKGEKDNQIGPHVCHVMRSFQKKPEYRALNVKMQAWYCLQSRPLKAKLKVFGSMKRDVSHSEALGEL